LDIGAILSRTSGHDNLIDLDVIQEIVNIPIDESIENMDKFIKDLIDTFKVYKLKKKEKRYQEELKR